MPSTSEEKADVQLPLLSEQTVPSKNIRHRKQQHLSSSFSHANRLIDRNGPHRQSLGSYNIKRIGGDWQNLYLGAPFHTILNTGTSRIIVGVFSLYFSVIFVFAIAYRFVSTSCNLGVTNLMQAWIFSLETIMTIGYGAPKDDIFFEECASMAFLLTFESFAGILLDSICIGVFYARLSRAQSRASTIVFSDYAVIQKIRGQYYLMFQVCERRKHQLVEAHVRCYAVRHEYGDSMNETALFQSYQMRLQQPDDDLGSCLLMVLPQLVVHRIDPWSPLFPKSTVSEYHASTSGAFPDPAQRAVDVESGNRETHKRACTPPAPTQEEIAQHLRQSEIEIIAILEGIDGPTSGTTQARHSYTENDIKWNHTFARCVSKNEGGGALIDFDKFHNVVPAPEDSNFVIPISR